VMQAHLSDYVQVIGRPFGELSGASE